MRQKEKLEMKIQSERIALADLSGLSVSIINLLAEKMTVTVASVVAATGANRNPVKTALKGLAKRGFIAQKGKGRGVFYMLHSRRTKRALGAHRNGAKWHASHRKITRPSFSP